MQQKNYPLVCSDNVSCKPQFVRTFSADECCRCAQAAVGLNCLILNTCNLTLCTNVAEKGSERETKNIFNNVTKTTAMFELSKSFLIIVEPT